MSLLLPYPRISSVTTLDPLQQLRDLDRSSPQFHDQLINLLRGEEFRNSVPNLQRDDLAWLVDHLDSILTAIPVPTSDAFQGLLHELKEICSARQILPRSYTLPVSRLNITWIGRLREGTWNGSRVRIRHVMTHLVKDQRKANQALYRVVVLWKHSAHPNIVPLLGATTDPLQLITDCMSNENLREYTTNHSDPDCFGLLSDVAEGLNYLHSCNVIHGGLRGSNILVDATGHAQITDIGLATVTKGPGFVWSGHRGYAARWTAPEILSGQGTHSKEADVFSFAMVIIEAFTNAAPFNIGSLRMVMSAIMGGKRPPRPTHSSLADWLWELTQRCWDPEVSQRPQISQVLEVLHRLGRSAWNRFITCPLTKPERISLIAAIFSDRDEIEAVGNLCGNDAQSFIDAADEVLDDPTLPFRKKCLRTVHKICGKHSLLPSPLQIPICYDPSGNALYSGGYADVWKGQHQGCSVAVKVLRVYSTSDFDKIKNRFCKEVMTWKTLRHPNVLPLLGATMMNKKFAMTSKWMENGNINEFIGKNKDADRFKLLRDITNGLVYLHDQAMVHGDLKGANILIDEHGNARLADFGLLIFISDPTNPTVSSSHVSAGTTRWMSPELLDPDQFGSKDGRPTKESDCYALGMVIYEVLSGKVPFASYREYVVMRKVIEGERPERPQGAEGERFADHLWFTLLRCWVQERKGRPTIEEVLECLGPTPEGCESNADRRVHDPERAVISYSPTLPSSTAITLPPTSGEHRQSGVKCAQFHVDVTSGSCLEVIMRVYFHCVICVSVDICSNCESAWLPDNLDSPGGRHDSSHVMIKIPYPIEPSKVQEVSRQAAAHWNRGYAERIRANRLHPGVRHQVHGLGPGLRYPVFGLGPRPRSPRPRSSSSDDESARLSARLSDEESTGDLDHGIKCDSCSQMIIGTRYQCGNCPSILHPYNLCQLCDDKSYMVHDPTHMFFKLPRPVDQAIESIEPFLPILYEAGVASASISDPHDPKAYLQNVKHADIFCDLCMENIQGQWFRCVYCPRDLCDNCEELDEHDTTHFSVVAKAPVDMNTFYHFMGMSAEDDGGLPIMEYAVYHS